MIRELTLEDEFMICMARIQNIEFEINRLKTLSTRQKFSKLPDAKKERHFRRLETKRIRRDKIQAEFSSIKERIIQRGDEPK